MSHTVVLAAVAIFAVTYAFIATEKVHRVAAALGGVAAMTAIGLVDADSAFFSRETGVDWNVIFLLFGMMVIVGILKHTGLFEFLALWAARTSRGRPARLMTLLILVTAAVGPILDNVTCVLLVAPVTLSVCQRLGLSPVPYLITLILAANIAGAATLIGDPPNIIIASRGGLTFNDFLVHSLPITVVLIGGLILLTRFLFRRELAVETAQRHRRHPAGRRHRRPASAGALPRRARDRDGRLQPAHRAAPRPVDRRDARRGRDGGGRTRDAGGVPRRDRVDDPGLLHGSLRAGRRRSSRWA